MELIRIGEKIINREKIFAMVDQVLKLRKEGLSQQEAALRLGLDRTFISRLEHLGEVRKGKRIAVIGFPVANKEELRERLIREGIDFIFLMTEAERWQFVKEKNGLELVNEVFALTGLVRTFDVIIVIGSNRRIEITQAFLGKEVLGIEIGQSPLAEDVYVEPERVLKIIASLQDSRRKEGKLHEAHCQY